MASFNEWASYFTELGLLRKREFQLIAEYLCSIENPVIIETGCIRKENGWIDEGNSTVIWNWFAERGAEVYSVDSNERTVELGRKLAPKVTVTYEDSIKYLAKEPAVERCNLLYLDSYDYMLGKEALSELHHAGELAVTYERLPSGCLIAIDDCIDNYVGDAGKPMKGGKHKLCEYFFDRAGIKPLFIGFITGWIKP